MGLQDEDKDQSCYQQCAQEGAAAHDRDHYGYHGNTAAAQAENIIIIMMSMLMMSMLT